MTSFSMILDSSIFHCPHQVPKIPSLKCHSDSSSPSSPSSLPLTLEQAPVLSSLISLTASSCPCLILPKSILQTASRMGFLKFKPDVTTLFKILHGFHSAIKITSTRLNLIDMVLAYLSILISCPFPPHESRGIPAALWKWHLSIPSMSLQGYPLCPPKTLFLPLCLTTYYFRFWSYTISYRKSSLAVFSLSDWIIPI